MNDEDFANLVESIKQAGQIKKGVLEPSRIFEFNPLDIKAIRKKFHQSQQEFAGHPLKTGQLRDSLFLSF